jgi:hypothetical protein
MCQTTRVNQIWDKWNRYIESTYTYVAKKTNVRMSGYSKRHYNRSHKDPNSVNDYPIEITADQRELIIQYPYESTSTYDVTCA